MALGWGEGEQVRLRAARLGNQLLLVCLVSPDFKSKILCPRDCLWSQAEQALGVDHPMTEAGMGGRGQGHIPSCL